ncbi:19636_t:CDS:1, partial [Gigaspora margarita]
FSESSQSSGTLAIANMLDNNLGLNSPMNISQLLDQKELLLNETTQKKHSSSSIEKFSNKKAKKFGER